MSSFWTATVELTINRTIPDRTHGVDEAKNTELTARTLAMLATAANYDVNDRQDRRRSARGLSWLFFHLIEFAGCDQFIEAGAKEADASYRARSLLGPDARVVAFEANPYTYEHYKSRFEDPDIDVEYRHLALSDGPDQVTFNVLLNEAGVPQANGMGSILPNTQRQGRELPVTVEATSLDTFFADQDFARAAVWADVEGAVREVLRGGESTLDRAAVVLIEVEDRHLWEGQWLSRDVASFMYDRGLVAVARDFQSRYQYNVLYVRGELLELDRMQWYIARHFSEQADQRIRALIGRQPTPDASALETAAAQSPHRAARKIGVGVQALRRAVRRVGRRLPGGRTTV